MKKPGWLEMKKRPRLIGDHVTYNFMYVWIFYSGASCRMCTHRDWFHSYTTCDGGKFLMANDYVAQVLG